MRKKLLETKGFCRRNSKFSRAIIQFSKSRFFAKVLRCPLSISRMRAVSFPQSPSTVRRGTRRTGKRLVQACFYFSPHTNLPCSVCINHRKSVGLNEYHKNMETVRAFALKDKIVIFSFIRRFHAPFVCASF